MSWALSTIHGRHICKDREWTITILAIQSKKAAYILKTIASYRWWESYHRWNVMHTITDQFLHNHWFARCSHWPDISQCTQTIHKSWGAGRKSNFSSKKCRRQQIESQDTTFVIRRLGVIQIYWYSLRCYWSCKLFNRVFKLIGFIRHATA
jgi:hypothetical protein